MLLALLYTKIVRRLGTKELLLQLQSAPRASRGEVRAGGAGANSGARLQERNPEENEEVAGRQAQQGALAVLGDPSRSPPRV